MLVVVLILRVVEREIMFARIIIVFLLIQASVITSTAFAQINYASLHEIESEAHQPLFVKLNLVEKGQTLPLKFTLLSQRVESELAHHKINNFMVRLASLRPAIGESYIVVYELNNNTWKSVSKIDISNKLQPIKNDSELTVKPKARQQLTQPEQIDKQHKNIQTPLVTKPVKNSNKCTLERTPKETLWSIASRYKKIWRVDIFSAMLAIYQTNKTQFTKQHIGYLIDNAALTCPMIKTLAEMGEKSAMKSEFNRLNRLPLLL